ncbi:MAG TPA: helix-turn-helix transcriptional regulator [Pseudonocardiaceae bacterium]|jgi:transcriptional regulator with XRE-family HTH domain|nr:helix-turn-helix transcriptional regulator [Pseudonocardiaceae bacterium]
MAVTHELGAVLRAWRDRLAPERAGLAVNAPRRASGLRREELAVLAGISADYIVRLEQGRASTPSAQVCAALARALQLSDAEQAHLFQLAGHTVDGRSISRFVPASVRRLLHQLDDHPVAVCDAMWTLISWNRLYAAVVGDPSALDDRHRNVLWRHFTGRPSRVSHSPAELAAFESSTVADLRTAAGRYPEDRQLAALITELSELSERFRTLWAARLVADHDQDHKTVEHPEVGSLDLDCDVLTTQRSDLRVVVYTAQPGSETQDKLDLLAAIGTQRMTDPAPVSPA